MKYHFRSICEAFMRILFFGRGVIGTQYAWAFEKAGHTVEFYVRKGRKAQYGAHIDLEIQDARRSKKDRRVKEKWPVVFIEEIPENHDYDLIFVSTNPEQVPEAVQYLAPRTGNATVLLMGNFWKDIRESVQPIPFSQVVWGSPGSGGGFEGNYLYGVLYKTVWIGKMGDAPTAREQAVRCLFTGAGFKSVLQADIQGWLRNHFIMNVAMEIEVLKCGSFKAVVTSQEALVNMSHSIREMIPILKAAGSQPDAQTKLLSFFPPRLFGFIMGNLVFSPKGMPYAAVEHNHYQVGASVAEMISEAGKYGIDAQRLYAAESLIERKNVNSLI